MKRLMLIWVGLPLLAVAQEQPVGPAVAERTEDFGAVVAPAAMPDGATALAGWVGVPEVGASFRQGISGWELGARARFDYLRLAVALEGVGRRKVWAQVAFELAPELGLGVMLDSGSRYFDEENFSGVFLRLSPGVVASWRVVETVKAVGLVEVPVDLGLSPTGTFRLKPLAGVGAEVYLGEDLSLLALGELGVDVLKEPRGLSQTRPGYGVRLGLGVRLF
ncbi:MAG TPA: hypothetical protein VLQ93_16230 [Myxococcaceae bacterium]|nr:hypothetical protein [Myxococcaceae bacterium]